jgi:glycosyltransferase A (GT-A) superfamily protein (DUF2064 family)
MEREISNLQKEQLKITIEQLSNSIEQLRNNLENMEGSDNSQVVKTLKANITYQKQIFNAFGSHIQKSKKALIPLYLLSGLSLISNIAIIYFLLWH